MEEAEGFEREIKSFQVIEIDTKDLSDIERY